MLQKGRLRVVLIDDMCEILAKNLYSKHDGIKITERKLDNYFIDMLEKTSYTKFAYEDEYLVIVDASYNNPDSNISALDIVEKAIQANPDLKNNIIVLLGADINQHMQYRASDGDYDAKVFLSRVRALPRLIYGENQTKIEAIIKLVYAYAKKHGYKIEKRLPRGAVSPEVMEKAHYVITKLKNAKNELEPFLTTNLNLPQPTTEEERNLINILKASDELCMDFAHDASNYLSLLSYHLKRIERQKAETANHKP